MRQASINRAVDGLIKRLATARQRVSELEAELATVQGRIQGAMPRPQAQPLPIELRQLPEIDPPGPSGTVNPSDNEEDGRWI